MDFEVCFAAFLSLSTRGRGWPAGCGLRKVTSHPRLVFISGAFKRLLTPLFPLTLDCIPCLGSSFQVIPGRGHMWTTWFWFGVDLSFHHSLPLLEYWFRLEVSSPPCQECLLPASPDRFLGKQKVWRSPPAPRGLIQLRPSSGAQPGGVGPIRDEGRWSSDEPEFSSENGAIPRNS